MKQGETGEALELLRELHTNVNLVMRLLPLPKRCSLHSAGGSAPAVAALAVLGAAAAVAVPV